MPWLMPMEARTEKLEDAEGFVDARLAASCATGNRALPSAQEPNDETDDGDEIIGTMTFHNDPLPDTSVSDWDWTRRRRCQLLWEAAAGRTGHLPGHGDELAGMPNHHVSRFHAIAPSRAQIST